jgi:hypothetical protein
MLRHTSNASLALYSGSFIILKIKQNLLGLLLMGSVAE